jgi:hypothetical protein
MVTRMTGNEGFLPRNMWELSSDMNDAHDAYKDGGRAGLLRHALEETSKDGNPLNGIGSAQLIDIPYVKFDDDYTIMEAANDVNDVVQYGADFYTDVITEVLALLGGLFGTIVNEANVEIDDFARPPLVLTDIAGIFLPVYRDRQAFTSETLYDLPTILCHLPPTTLVLSDRRDIVGSLLRPHVLGLPDSTMAAKPAITRWKGGSREGVWS